MILTVTRRLVDSTSYVVLSSSTSGQLTIPLVDPETGKTAHYALVKVDTPPSVSSLGLSPRLHMRSVSDSGHPHTSGPKSETACRLDRLEKECMLDVSREALRMLEDDTAWPRLASSSRSSPSRVLAPTASSFSSAYVVHKQQTAYAETPSMFNESRSEDSVSYVGTPVSPSHSQRQNTVTAFGSTSARNSAMLVGLGIIGMTKEDGSPFDGLGSLPRIVYASRTTHFPMTSPPAYAPASEPSWPFLHGLSPAAFANDTSEDPITRFWKTATAADFRRYLDDSVFSHQLTAPLGACGSWKVAKKARTACAPSLAPVSRGHKKHFSMPRAGGYEVRRRILGEGERSLGCSARATREPAFIVYNLNGNATRVFKTTKKGETLYWRMANGKRVLRPQASCIAHLNGPGSTWIEVYRCVGYT